MVREKPLLYDEELQASVPEAQLKKQKREAWDRIRADMMWQDMTPVQDVWSDLLEQYVRKSDSLSETLLEAMRWTDAHVSKKKCRVSSSRDTYLLLSFSKYRFATSLSNEQHAGKRFFRRRSTRWRRASHWTEHRQSHSIYEYNSRLRCHPTNTASWKRNRSRFTTEFVDTNKFHTILQEENITS